MIVIPTSIGMVAEMATICSSDDTIEALVGSALGARQRPALRRAALLTSQWGVGVSIPLALFFLLAGPWMIDLMATAPAVRIEARVYLPWVAAAPIIGVASWMLDIGATRTRDMRNAMTISAAIYILALLLLVGPYGNHGLWMALMVLNVARAVTLGLRYPALEAAAER